MQIVEILILCSDDFFAPLLHLDQTWSDAETNVSTDNQINVSSTLCRYRGRLTRIKTFGNLTFTCGNLPSDPFPVTARSFIRDLFNLRRRYRNAQFYLFCFCFLPSIFASIRVHVCVCVCLIIFSRFHLKKKKKRRKRWEDINFDEKIL